MAELLGGYQTGFKSIIITTFLKLKFWWAELVEVACSIWTDFSSHSRRKGARVCSMCIATTIWFMRTELEMIDWISALLDRSSRNMLLSLQLFHYSSPLCTRYFKLKQQTCTRTTQEPILIFRALKITFLKANSFFFFVHVS